MEFFIETEDTQDGVPVVHVHGDIDLNTCSELHQALAPLLEQNNPVIVLDLAEALYVDSAGISTLISAFREARDNGGALHLVGVRDQLLRALEITRLNRLFSVHDSVASALEAIRQHS